MWSSDRVNKRQSLSKIKKELTRKAGLRKPEAASWLVTQAVTACRNDYVGITVSLNSNYWIGHSAGVGYKSLIKLVNWLEETGRVDIYKGYKDSRGGGVASSPTVLIFKKTFINELSKVNQKAAVHKKGLVKSTHEIIKRGTKERLPLVGIPDFEENNDLLLRWAVLLDGKVTYEGHPTGYIQAVRKFTDRYGLGGRLYLGGVQTLKASNRLKHIKLNNNPVVELDYSSQHPNFLYQLNNNLLGREEFTKEALGKHFTPYGADVYDLVTIEQSCIDEMTKLHGKPYDPIRALCKSALMMCINTTSRKSAAGALRKAIEEDREKDFSTRKFHGATISKYAEFCQRLADHNDTIKGGLFIGYGLILQMYDSMIALNVVGTFVDQGLPILSYHDSFIVEEENEDFLRETMAHAWGHVMGSPQFCKIDKK
jgi:hypothetical protein